MTLIREIAVVVSAVVLCFIPWVSYRIWTGADEALQWSTRFRRLFPWLSVTALLFIGGFALSQALVSTAPDAATLLAFVSVGGLIAMWTVGPFLYFMGRPRMLVPPPLRHK